MHAHSLSSLVVHACVKAHTCECCSFSLLFSEGLIFCIKHDESLKWTSVIPISCPTVFGCFYFKFSHQTNHYILYCSMNVALEGLVVQDLQLARDHQKPCLSLILTQVIPGQGIWRGTSINMEKY
jgi:hypothetical protein